VFRRRRSAGQPLAALLDNYLVRAEAIADGGGGNLWVIEPTVPPELLSDFTEAVVLHLMEHGVDVDGFGVLEGTASARVVVLDAWDAGDQADDPDDDAGGSDVDPVPLPDVALRPAERTPPAPRRPVDEEEPGDVPDRSSQEKPEEPDDTAAGVVDRAYESRSAR
jgi:hypothetical protein